MGGTVTVVVAPAEFGRAGRLKVRVDGAVAGKVRQGSSLDVEVDAGTHQFRVSGGAGRSKDVAVTVSDGSEHSLDAGIHRGLTTIVWFAGAVIGYFTGVLLLIPLVLVLYAIPGSWFYLRNGELRPSPTELEDAAVAVAAPKTTTGEMWWMNDPNLAKRYRKAEVRSSQAPKP
jgi:hypothetical protein